jgi:hypothetical protein
MFSRWDYLLVKSAFTKPACAVGTAYHRVNISPTLRMHGSREYKGKPPLCCGSYKVGKAKQTNYHLILQSENSFLTLFKTKL